MTSRIISAVQFGLQTGSEQQSHLFLKEVGQLQILLLQRVIARSVNGKRVGEEVHLLASEAKKTGSRGNSKVGELKIDSLVPRKLCDGLINLSLLTLQRLPQLFAIGEFERCTNELVCKNVLPS